MLGPTQAYNELVQDSSFIPTQPLSDSQPESSVYTQSSEHAASQPPKVSLRYDAFRNSTQDVLATIMTRAANMQSGTDTSPSRKRRRQEPPNQLTLSDSYVESSPLDDGSAEDGPVIADQTDQSSSLTQPAANVLRYCDSFDIPTAVRPPSPPPSATSYSNLQRVLARWPDRKWYPATIIGCRESEKVLPSPARRRTPARGSQPDEPLYSVQYDDGNTAEGLQVKQLRLLDLRTGDKCIGRITSSTGKIVAAGVEITSSSPEDSVPFSSSPTQPDSFEAGTSGSHLPDAKGHTHFTFDAYNEKTKTRIEVADDCRYIRLADLCVTDRQVERQWTDRLWKSEYFGVARAPSPTRSGLPSERGQVDWDGFGNSSLTSLATSPVQPLNRVTRALSLPVSSQASCLAFEQTAFVITGIKDDAIKTALGKAISHRGGHVISSLQDSLRVDADGVLLSDLRKPVIVISDGYVRTATWMMALSLKLPIVSHRWVEDSAKRTGRQSVDWIPYALSTGHSDYLGGWSAPSPEMFLRAAMPLSERLEQRNRTSAGLLQGQKCLLVMSARSSLKDREIFKCLLQTCGASYVETVTTEQQIRTAFGKQVVLPGSKSEIAQSKRKRPRRSRQDSVSSGIENGRRARSLSEPGSTVEWDRVIVEDEKRLNSVRSVMQTASARTKRLKTKTWLFDSLIMGKVLPA